MTIQQAFSIPVGITPYTTSLSRSLEVMNAAANYMAYSFVAESNTSLSAVRFDCSSLVGSPAINCFLYGDAGGKPDSSGTLLDTLTVGTLTNNAFCAATGGTYSLTQGTRYWVVFTNTAATPSSNNMTFIYGTSGSSPEATNNGLCATSANSGTSWTVQQNVGCIRFDFADGTYQGWPIASTTGSASLSPVYSSREYGARFTTPSNVKLNVAGLGFLVSAAGTPTGNMFFKLYDASHNLIAQTDAILNAEAKVLGGWKARMFTSTYGIQTLSPATTYSVTIAESTNSDTSSNVFRGSAYNFDTDSNSQALIPWSVEQDYYNGSTWAQDNSFVPCFALLLATGGEFTSSGGGAAGMLYSPGMDGGCNL